MAADSLAGSMAGDDAMFDTSGVDDTHTWMQYPPTGGTARFPHAAVDAWAARGWVPCPPPPEPDLYHDDPVPEPPAEPEPAPEPEPEVKPAKSQPAKEK